MSGIRTSSGGYRIALSRLYTSRDDKVEHSKEVATMKLDSKIVTNPDILGGTPVVEGTRVPVANVLAAVHAGENKFDIFRHYPSLPLDGIEICVEWEKSQKQRLHACPISD